MEVVSEKLGGALRITDVRKSYGGERGVDSVSIDVAPGEFFTMLGPSGSGKTTTLNLVAGFLQPDAGSIELDGRELSGVPPHKRGLGMVFQQYALFPHMTIAENVAYPLQVRKMPKMQVRSLVDDALAMVKLTEMASRKPAQLSGGQQQRVALARAFVFKPRLLLMDEPLGALDKKLRAHLQVEISRICRELGATVVYVTHDQEEALALSDRIAIYNEGRIEQLGTPEDLYQRPRSVFVADFVGESTIIRGHFNSDFLIHDGQKLHTGPAMAPVGEHAPAALVVRPERFTVAASTNRPAPTHESENCLEGTVLEWTYLGVARQCLIRTSTGLVICARVNPDHDISGLPVGAGAVVSWCPGDSVLVPDTQTT
ncbi:MAG: ABC transporter ATP-binding protein [Hyphomicrobiales bacterium]|nr:MAG: ABC transporter ATP-binding protein [Hyphomicrobiales bacterium]